jgi:hypothetical protein
MWVYVRSGRNAFNLDHVSRLFVEETGSGAALKAELAGKTVMVNYFSSKADAQAALDQIMEQNGAGVAIVQM